MRGVRVRDLFFRSALAKEVVHPLLYPHPFTGNTTMMFGLGSLSGRYLQQVFDASLVFVCMCESQNIFIFVHVFTCACGVGSAGGGGNWMSLGRKGATNGV